MSKFLTAKARDLAALRAKLRHDPAFVVIGLCAAWCRICGEFEDAFDRLARERPDALFLWLDIEDDSAVVGDIEVENFPTLAVYRDGVTAHFGISLPQEAVVRRVLEALATAERSAAPAALPAVETLLQRVRELAG
jgi:thioredoxin reductase (NADPH)